MYIVEFFGNGVMERAVTDSINDAFEIYCNAVRRGYRYYLHGSLYMEECGTFKCIAEWNAQ